MIRAVAVLLLLSHLCSAESNSVGSDESASNSVDSNEEAGRRVIGGNDATLGQFPYVVRLSITFPGKYFWFNYFYQATCTATVISLTEKDIVILTAGHCLNNQGSSAVNVTAQLANQVGNKEYKKVVHFYPNDMHVHPNYTGFGNDIAILKTSHHWYSDYNFGTPPSLPSAETVTDLFTSPTAIIVGWGKTTDDGDLPSTLQWAEVNTITNDDCRKKFKKYITDRVVCTMDRGKGICNGDSGGPLLITRNEVTYIVGVSSFGARRCEAYYPSAYTYVLAYTDWIHSTISTTKQPISTSSEE